MDKVFAGEYGIVAKNSEICVDERTEENIKILRLVDPEDVFGANVSLELVSSDEYGSHTLLNEFLKSDVEIIIRRK